MRLLDLRILVRIVGLSLFLSVSASALITVGALDTPRISDPMRSRRRGAVRRSQ